MSNRPNAKPPSSARVNQARQAEQGSRRWIAVVIVVVVVLGALAVALLVSGEGGGGSTTGEELVYGTVKVTGAPLAELSADANSADPAVGQPAPEVVGQKFDGSALTIPAQGTPKVVMFVAHWCSHCQKEVPLLSEHLAAQGMPAGVDLFAVSTAASDSNPNFPPAPWLDKEKWPVTTLVDDEAGQAAQAFGLSGFPYFVAVDADGKVVQRMSGEISVEQFDELVAKARSTGNASS